MFCRFHFVKRPGVETHRMTFWIHFLEMLAFCGESLGLYDSKNKVKQQDEDEKDLIKYGLGRLPVPIFACIVGQAAWLAYSFKQKYPQASLL